MENREDVIEIDLQELFGIVLHHLWLIILSGIVAGTIGFCVSFFLLTPQYESTTKIYILTKQNSNTVTYSDMQLGTQLTKDYTELIKTRDVLERVIINCGLQESYEKFADRVKVSAISDTRIVSITVRDADPAMAQQIAGEICKEAAEHIKNVTDIEAVNVAEEANLPLKPADPSIPKWTVIGALLGMLLAGGIVVLRFLLDDTVKTSEDVERYLGLSTLAMIPIIDEEKSQNGKKNKKKHRSPEVNAQGEAIKESGEDELELNELSEVKETKDGEKK